MPAQTEFQDSTPLLDDPPALRRKMNDDSFLFFRGLLPREAVLDLRRQILLIMQRNGWLSADAPLMDGLIDPSVYQMETWGGVGVTREAYADIYRLEAFHRLAHHPAVIRALELLMGEAVLPHPRNIARMMFPTPAHAPTPPHQDYIHIQGTPSVYTCWLPAGDCSQSLGGLSLMRGSHTVGILPVRASEGAGGRAVILDGLEQEWVTGDFAAGDVLLFHSLTVHKSLPNQFPNRLRLSVDYRYQPVSLPIEERSLLPHGDVIPWEDVYATWPTDELQYYWRKHDLTFQEFDRSLLEMRPG
jgi:ectoine hydroxylase-related dioxygenase (phytanoyl-CoA dioxygenase family)